MNNKIIKRFYFFIGTIIMIILISMIYRHCSVKKEFHSIDNQDWNWEDRPGVVALIAYIEDQDWPSIEPWLR